MSVSGPPVVAPNKGFHPADDTADVRDRPSTSSNETPEGVSGESSSKDAAKDDEEDADKGAAAAASESGDETKR